MITIGTWTTKSALSSPAETAASLHGAGVNMVSIMLNDFAGDRSEQEFTTHDPGKLEAFAAELAALGISVTLTTWVMPHEVFIRGMAEQLPALMLRTRATDLVLDAEEPWTQATGGMPHDAAAELIRDLMPDPHLVLSGISYANTDALRGLSKICGTWSPQAYATTNTGSMDPAVAVSGSLSRWRSRFGEPEDGWMMGLACYSQPSPASTYMQPCLDQCAEGGVSSVCYWSHKPIMDRADVREVLLRARGLTPSSCSHPTLNIPAMSSSQPNNQVADMQWFLLRHGYGPGGLVSNDDLPDGKPGPGTEGELRGFQGERGLTADAICGPDTWKALFS